MKKKHKGPWNGWSKAEISKEMSRRQKVRREKKTANHIYELKYQWNPGAKPKQADKICPTCGRCPTCGAK